jgi:diguanylate cyclase (GGDEF)-like protein/PAS domain S-box-containing protein
LRDANQRLSFHIDNSPLAVVEMDNQLRLTHCSCRAIELFGWHEELCKGQSVPDLLTSGGGNQTALRAALARLCHQVEIRNQSESTHHLGAVRHCDWFNSALTDSQGHLVSIMSLVEDVTARTQAAHQLTHQAERDSLTQLYNRHAFKVRLDESLARARRSGATVAVLFIDLDGFKTVNDNLGHQAGDQALCDVAQRLVGLVRESDIVARLGGDEFVVLLDTEVQPGTTELLGQRILAAMGEPFVIDGVPLLLSVSIGVAERVAPLDTESGTLIELADEAMYEAKRAGKAQVYHSQMGGLDSVMDPLPKRKNPGEF